MRFGLLGILMLAFLVGAGSADAQDGMRTHQVAGADNGGSAMPGMPPLPPGKYKIKISPFALKVPTPTADGSAKQGEVSSQRPIEVEFEVEK